MEIFLNSRIMKRARIILSLISNALKSATVTATFVVALDKACFPAFAQDTITLVSSLPRTGSANLDSTSIANGIQLAISEVNGVVAGMPIRYEDWDDASPERGAWDPMIEVANANKAVRDSSVMVFIGPLNSGAAKVSMPILNKAGLAQITPGSSWPGLTKEGLGTPGEPHVYRPSGRITFFRLVPADDLQAPAAAEWAKELGKDRIFVIHDRELYGKGIAEIFAQSAKRRGLEIVGFEGIDPKASNYKPLANKIRATRPSLIYFGGTTQTNAGQVVKDVRSIGIDTPFMFPSGCYQKALISAAGAENLNDRAYLTFSGLLPQHLKGRGRDFYAEYKTRFGTEPEGWAVYGYEAARVALKAIGRVGRRDRAAILAAIRETKDYEGALGTWSFDENGDSTLRTLTKIVVRDGAFEYLPPE